MKILAIHNNNIPFYLRSADTVEIDDAVIEVKYLNYGNAPQNSSFDTYVSEELSFLAQSCFDIILIPFTLSDENYMEYTGIRVAAHIRLTPEWKKLTTPILFIGPDTTDDITKLSSLGNIINSYHVFMTDKKEKDELMDVIREIIEKYPSGDDDNYITSRKYRNFLNSIYLSPPANYDTHHSIANEWAIIRWIDMFTWKEKTPELKEKHILNMLYFKHELAKVANAEGEREQFTKKAKKKEPFYPRIEGIKKKRILYVDDEGDKGWYNLLDKIFENSGAELIPWESKIGQSKELQIEDIKSFVKKNPADAYLIDLRLNDEDIEESESKNLTGLIITDYIKKLNKGNQIVIFTASNKTWNYEAAIFSAGAMGYTIKESPEYNYTREESYKNFLNFARLIKKAVNKSYITEYVELLDKCKDLEPNSWNALNNYIDLLILDETKTIKANILNLMVFLERYFGTKYKIEPDNNKGRFKLMNTNNNRTYATFRPKSIHLVDNLSYVKFNQPLEKCEKNEMFLDVTKKPLSLILIVLYYKYHLDEDDCNMILRLRQERVKSAAHQGDETNMTVQDLNDIFRRIIKKILKTDFLKIINVDNEKNNNPY